MGVEVGAVESQFNRHFCVANPVNVICSNGNAGRYQRLLQRF